ncbi:N-acetylglucosaminyldiphosphoundecaprenol N-acetyl-beta-D-mannosaminyltransferase [Monaibacterium marinum]|uniref:N-acetylglucosaminyldiphosphoundecaprenol N-acetyl-beta-D-mannosaminyltransferase n=1 Tax=Pontivivens marinum TaxID=1690039 RepID=A0A2C9CWG2_9RHOB|nr:WecB/TagA/CpsF family glycosyltransferase [Monaibacterium marinum]SOH95455.1 N-acetylglucosaminyldiphosphoundecaprenol N-acetyl-beta-D-mannosaminyltransferase [Monaibacterium marinum]
MSVKPDTFDVLGIPIAVTSLPDAQARIEGWAADQTGRYVGVREAASSMAMSDDPDLLAIAQGAAMNVPDGMPLVWIGKLRGLPVQRTCGPDLIDHMMATSAQSRLKHYLYGGKEGVADTLRAVFESRYPGVQIVGTECPPFRALTQQEDAAVVERISASGADVVWVGISSPKQDVWMRDHVDALPQTLIGVGAAFDFHSGAVQRAPVWMQKSGLEWLHRLSSEPRRLWRRYLILVPRFAWRVLRAEVQR